LKKNLAIPYLCEPEATGAKPLTRMKEILERNPFFDRRVLLWVRKPEKAFAFFAIDPEQSDLDWRPRNRSCGCLKLDLEW
jgi:hypothetical protein